MNARLMQRVWVIPGHRQMECHDFSNGRLRNICSEIKPVEMDYVDVPTLECLLNRATVDGVSLRALRFRNLIAGERSRPKLSAYLRAFGGNHKGVDVPFRKSAIEQVEDLLCSTTRTRANWQQRICDVENSHLCF